MDTVPVSMRDLPAQGVFIFKVVDSDDWLDGTAYQKLLEKIRYYCKEAGGGEEKPDLFVCNYVYNHLEQQITRSMGYGNVFPAEKICHWSETGHFLPSQYLVMHALVYRTEILRQSGIVLPEHTFYVDNLFAYCPLPYVRNIFYMDIDLYQYYLGRDDQSVNEQMLKKADRPADESDQNGDRGGRSYKNKREGTKTGIVYVPQYLDHDGDLIDSPAFDWK